MALNINWDAIMPLLSMGANILFALFFVMIGMWTNAFRELKARGRRYVMATFYSDNGRILERVPVKIESEGIVKDKQYGVFLFNKGGVYLDTHTRIPHVVFNTSRATSINMTAAQSADQIMKVVEDPLELAKIRMQLDKNELPEDSPFVGLRENLSLSPIKYMLNAFSPDTMKAQIDKEVAIQNAQQNKPNTQMLWFVLMAIGGFALITIIVVIMLKNNQGSGAVTVVREFVTNSSIIA